MIDLDKNQQYSFDLSINLGADRDEKPEAGFQVVRLHRTVQHQERIEAVSRLQNSRIFDTSRFERLVKQP